jgi:hypothetical protein
VNGEAGEGQDAQSKKSRRFDLKLAEQKQHQRQLHKHQV